MEPEQLAEVEDIIKEIQAFEKEKCHESGGRTICIASSKEYGRIKGLKKVLAGYAPALFAEVQKMHRFATDVYQDDCENAYVQTTIHDATRQALAEVAPDHPMLKMPVPSYGVWESQQEEIKKLQDENDKMLSILDQCVNAINEARPESVEREDLVKYVQKAMADLVWYSTEVEILKARVVRAKKRPLLLIDKAIARDKAELKEITDFNRGFTDCLQHMRKLFME